MLCCLTQKDFIFHFHLRNKGMAYGDNKVDVKDNHCIRLFQPSKSAVFLILFLRFTTR